MKDVISMLQSRVAKRKKEFFKLMMPLYKDEDVFGRSEYNKIRDGLKPNHPAVVALAEQQKTDKHILAEIIRLRRELKERDVILDRFYRAEEI